MKKTVKLLALLMALAMMISCLVACGDADVKKTKKHKNNDEVSNTDILDTADEETGIVGTWEGEIKLSEIEAEAAGTALGDFEMGIIVKFDNNDKMTVSTDIDRDGFKKAFKEYMIEMLEEEGMTEADYEAATGETINAAIDAEIDELMEEAEYEETGYYKYEDDMLYTRESESDEWEETPEFEIKGNKMTISIDEDGSEFVLTLKRK